MGRAPRRRRITPLDAAETDTSQEGEETGEINAPGKPGASEKVEESTETQDTETSVSSDNEYEGEDTMTALNIETASEDELVSAIRDVLDRLSMEGLVRVIDFAQEKRSAKQEEAKAELLEEFRNRAAAIGMSLESLIPTMGGGTRRRSSAIEFWSSSADGFWPTPRSLNPTVAPTESGDLAWTGKPKWICSSNCVGSMSSGSARSRVLPRSSVSTAAWCARRWPVRCPRRTAIRRGPSRSLAWWAPSSTKFWTRTIGPRASSATRRGVCIGAS